MITGERFVTGLDITSTHTCAVVLSELAKRDDEPPASRVLGVGLSATEGMRNDTVTNLEATLISLMLRKCKSNVTSAYHAWRDRSAPGN